MHPAVSVIVPVYNGEKFIKKCVESIAVQTIKELQIIVVDDGSQDRTLEIMHGLKTQDCRITLIHQENAGVSKARNVGLQAVQAEWVVFVDSDDTIAENYCESLLRTACSLQADVVIARQRTDECGDSFILNEHDKLIQACLAYDEVSYLFNIDAPWGKIFRYKLIADYHLSFPEKLTRSEDAFFCLQFYEKAKRIGVLNRFGYYHSEREGSLCRSFAQNAPEILENVLTENSRWVEKNHDGEQDYMKALWYRVLPGIVECERTYFLHSNFHGRLAIEYQKFLKQKMISCAIRNLKLSDVNNRSYKIRLLFYKLHMGWMFILLKRK